MKKDNIFKKFLTVTVLLVCSFLLFSGVVLAKNNTEKSLKAIQEEKIDETMIINKIEEEITKFLSRNK